MTNDISGFGLKVIIVADKTYPFGYPVTQFADDSDPLDMSSIQIADKAMGLNGDLLFWAKANPLPMVLNVIPGSEDDVALGILAENNRVGQGKNTARDVITATIIYPDLTQQTLSLGGITDSPFGKSVASAGRLKTKTYAFAFQNKVGA